MPTYPQEIPSNEANGGIDAEELLEIVSALKLNIWELQFSGCKNHKITTTSL